MNNLPVNGLRDIVDRDVSEFNRAAQQRGAAPITVTAPRRGMR